MYVETVDGSLKEETIDIDSNHCCGIGYAAHCLRTYGASKNTSAQHKRHGETTNQFEKLNFSFGKEEVQGIPCDVYFSLNI